jgi:cobalamin biosynthesis Co2+ chelatase CbiK
MPHSEDPGSTRHNVLVTVEERAHARLEEVAKDLRKRGLKVVDVFPLGGVIAGEAKREDLARLREVGGVASVELDQSFTAD